MNEKKEETGVRKTPGVLQNEQTTLISVSNWYENNKNLTSDEKKHILFLIQDFIQKKLKVKTGPQKNLDTLKQHGTILCKFLFESSRGTFLQIDSFEKALQTLRDVSGISKIVQDMKDFADCETILITSRTKTVFKCLYDINLSHSELGGIDTWYKFHKKCQDVIFWINLTKEIFTTSKKRFKFLLSHDGSTGELTINRRLIFMVFIVSIVAGIDKRRFSIDEMDLFLDKLQKNPDWLDNTKSVIRDNFPQFYEGIFESVEMKRIINTLSHHPTILDIANMVPVTKESMQILNRLQAIRSNVIDVLFPENSPKTYVEIIETNPELIGISDPRMITRVEQELYYLVPLLKQSTLLRLFVRNYRKKNSIVYKEILKQKKELFEKISQKDTYSLEEVFTQFWTEEKPFGFDRSYFNRDSKKNKSSDDSEKVITYRSFIFYKLIGVMKFNNFCEWLNMIYESYEKSMFPVDFIPDWFLIALHCNRIMNGGNAIVPIEYYSYPILPELQRFLINEAECEAIKKIVASRKKTIDEKVIEIQKS